MKRSAQVLILLLVILIIICLIIGTVLYLVFIYNPPVEKPVIEKPIIPPGTGTGNGSGEVEIKPEYLTYIYNELGAYKLKNPPLSSKTPKIITDVEGELFYSEVVKHEIITKRGSVEGVDLKFFTTKNAIVNSVNSENIGETFKETINSGESTFEMVADQKTLLLKGYLGLYEEITGETISLTGGVIKIFK